MSTLPADESKEAVEELQLKQILAFTLENKPEYKIAEDIGISRHRVRKIRNSEKFKDMLKAEGDRAVGNAREKVRAKLEDLAPLALEALKRNLEEGKIEGVRLYAEMVGLKNKEEDKPQDGTINVILPGAAVPKEVIDVKSEVKDA